MWSAGFVRDTAEDPPDESFQNGGSSRKSDLPGIPQSLNDQETLIVDYLTLSVFILISYSPQVQSEKRKLEQEVVNLNERTRLQEEENVRLKSEVSFLRWVILVG